MEEIKIPETIPKHQLRKNILLLIRLSLLAIVIWVSYELMQETHDIRAYVLAFLALGLGVSWGSRHDDVPD